MANETVHSGTRSWWDGSVTTLCGLKLEKAQRKWFSTGPTCPACRKLNKQNRK